MESASGAQQAVRHTALRDTNKSVRQVSCHKCQQSNKEACGPTLQTRIPAQPSPALGFHNPTGPAQLTGSAFHPSTPNPLLP
jgi:hypothetical protein